MQTGSRNKAKTILPNLCIAAFLGSIDPTLQGGNFCQTGPFSLLALSKRPLENKKPCPRLKDRAKNGEEFSARSAVVFAIRILTRRHLATRNRRRWSGWGRPLDGAP